MSIRNTAEDDLGAGHFMNSDITLQDGNQHVDGMTRTRTVTWFGGFTGGVQLIFFDANNVAIGSSNIHSFGVDGRNIGRSDRTDYWGEDLQIANPERIAGFIILEFWHPRWGAIDNIVQHAVQIGQDVGPLVQTLRDLRLIN